MRKRLLKLFGFKVREPKKPKAFPNLISPRRRKTGIGKMYARDVEKRAQEIISRLSQNEYDFPSPPLYDVINLAEELRLIEPFVQTPQMHALRNSVRKELGEAVRKLEVYIKIQNEK